MRKKYPYLQEQYVYNLNEEQNKRKFLSRLDNEVNQKQYVQITLLDWEENPLKEIQGEISGGSISIDGASSLRRSANLNCTVSAGEYNIDNLNMDFSLNKKVFIEVGIKNNTGEYKDWPILWFPFGVMVITGFSLNSSSTSAVNLTINLKDKMCLLNGDVGGRLPTSVQFDIMDTQLPDGQWVQQKVLIYNIIIELVNHYGQEEIQNILIQDVPLRIKQVMKWTGTNNLYYKSTSETSGQQWTFDTNKISSNYYETGEDVGYIYRDFVVNDELVGSAGTPITTILDNIKNILGNYEYFYDVFGIFHFREIKNYLNITQAQILEEEMSNPGRRVRFNGGNFLLDDNSKNQYLIETTNEKVLYSFSDDVNVTSITVTPQYDSIKNDYIIEGLRPGTSSDIKHSVRYHLVIDEKPQPIGTDDKGNYYGIHSNIIYYTDISETELDRINKLAVIPDVYQKQSFKDLPNTGNMDVFYFVKNENKTYYWNNTSYQEVFLITGEGDNEVRKSVAPIKEYRSRDWRTYLYLRGLEAKPFGLDEGYYFAELEAFWPIEYNLDPNDQRFKAEKKNGKYTDIHFLYANTGNFFLDFIDASSSSLGEFSVGAIGRRQDVVNDEKINCLFAPEIPNVIFLNIDDPMINWTDNTSGYLTEDEINVLYPTASNAPLEKKILGIQRQECIENNQPYTQIGQQIYSNLTVGGYSNSAYEAIRYELFCHTRYQKTVSITSIPIFYLDANSRVELSSQSTNIYGDFMIQNINITLGPGANMSVVLNEVAERL